MAILYGIVSSVWYAVSLWLVVKGSPLSEYGVALALGALFDIIAHLKRGGA